MYVAKRRELAVGKKFVNKKKTSNFGTERESIGILYEVSDRASEIKGAKSNCDGM